MAMISIAISFLIMIVSVSVASGYREEIKNGISAISGDIRIEPSSSDYLNNSNNIIISSFLIERLNSLDNISEISPVIYRAGIIKKEDNLQGLIFKGIEKKDSTAFGVSVPSKLADLLELKKGDEFISYFPGEKIKVRKFKVRDIYNAVLESEDKLVVYANISDMRRLNGWEEDRASALEIFLKDNSNSSKYEAEIGNLIRLDERGEETDLVAVSAERQYFAILNWLELIDFNVLFILALMTIVAGFNMVSGLLIMLFQNISTIGLLKSLGMTNNNIAAIFLKVASGIAIKGIIIGNIIAVLLCELQNKTHVLKLDPDNYFISFVPIKLDLQWIATADILSYIVIMLLLLLPCLFISNVDPAKTVRVR